MHLQKRKRIFRILYGITLLLTALVFVIFIAVSMGGSQNDSVDDIFGDTGVMDFVMTAYFIAFFVLPVFILESEVFYNLWYFTSVKEKALYKAAANVSAMVFSLLSVAMFLWLQRTVNIKAAEAGILLSLGAWFLMRILYLFLRSREKNKAPAISE